MGFGRLFAKGITPPHRRVEIWIPSYSELVPKLERDGVFALGELEGALREAGEQLAAFNPGRYWRLTNRLAIPSHRAIQPARPTFVILFIHSGSE